MPDYVERDGDWVLRPPGALYRVTMSLFALKASKKALQAMACRFIDQPSGNKVRADVPLGFVLLVCADIRYGYSEDPTDRQRGFMTERDVGFFVPAILTGDAGIHPVTLLPYLFVDNFAAVVIGREIYGFPKVLGHMSFVEDPAHFEVRTLVSERLEPDRCVVERAAIVIRAARNVGTRAVRKGTIHQMIAAMHRHVLKSLGLPALRIPGFDKVSMAFLKQFRSVESGTQACFQSIVRAEATVKSLSQPRILLHDYEVDLPTYPSLHIGEELGLRGSTPYKPFAAFRVDLDFVLPYGETLWQSP